MRAQREQEWGSYAGALFATVVWGLTFVAIPLALAGFGAFEIVWLRNALGAALLYLVLRRRGVALLPRREDLPRCALLGLIFGGHMLVQTVAMRVTPAMRAGWIIAFIPAVVAVGSRWFLAERLSARAWSGVALASCGVLALTSADLASLASPSKGELLILTTCFSWAAYTLLSVGPIRRNGALRVTAFAMLVSALPNLAAALAFPAAGAHPSLRSVAALAFLGLLASALATWAFNSAVSVLGPARSSAFQYLQPFVTSLGSWALLREQPTREVLVGGPIVLAGVWLIQRGRRAP